MVNIDNIFDILNNRKAVNIFLNLDNNNTISLIQNQSSTSYPYVHKFINRLEKYQLVRKVKAGRIHKVYYTPKGEEIAILLKNINEIYNK